jgi:large subunit ribosomal protein L28
VVPQGSGWRTADDDSHAAVVVGYSCAVARQAGRSIQTSSLQEFTVAAVCDICAKKPGFGNNRPWSRKITKRRFNPNIQRVRATVNGTPKRLNVCTGCLKAGKVSR